MLDFRIYTFLELCKTLSYTKTAENLHMTQPAVTQHIKFLEEFYKNKLFLYSGRTLSLTEYGKLLYRYLVAMNSDSEKIKEKNIEPIFKYSCSEFWSNSYNRRIFNSKSIKKTFF